MRSRGLLGMMIVVMLTFLSSRADLREAAFCARDLLGPAVWSRVLRIELARPGGGPLAVVHALVFELEGRLWYYDADSGTQSLSLFRGRLAEDKLKLDALLREIDPGFLRYKVVKPPPHPGPGRDELPNGCFIQCVAYLRTLVEAGEPPDEARILAYYAAPAGGLRGHTVLYFVRGPHRFFYDREQSAKPLPIPDGVPVEPLAMALVATPGKAYAKPQRAVFLPLRLPVPGVLAGAGRAVAGGGSAGEGADAPVLSR